MNHLYRSNTNRIFGGVCGGLAEYFHVDATLVRVLFITLAVMFSGVGLPLYLLLWLFVPRRDMPPADHDDSIRQNAQEMRTTFNEFRARRWGGAQSGDRELIGGAILVAAGLLLLLRNLNVLSFLNELWPLGLIAVGILILIQTLKK